MLSETKTPGDGGEAGPDNSARLVTMANQIAQFFESYPHAEAVAGVASHINQFWDPRMRRRFLDAAARHEAALHAAVRDALQQVKG